MSKRYKSIRLKKYESAAGIIELRKKNLTTEQIKEAIEYVMKVDLMSTSRVAYMIRAKSIFHYITRITGKGYSECTRVLGANHATARHHYENVRLWLKLNDEEIALQIDEIFNTRFYVSKEERELNKITKHREDLLNDLIGVVNSIPIKNSKEALERFKAIANSYNFKKAETKTKVFTGSESMSDYCF